MKWQIEKKTTITSGNPWSSYPTNVYRSTCKRFRVFKVWNEGQGPLAPCGWSWTLVDLEKSDVIEGWGSAKSAKRGADKIIMREAA